MKSVRKGKNIQGGVNCIGEVLRKKRTLLYQKLKGCQCHENITSTKGPAMDVHGLEAGTKSEFHFGCRRRQIGSFELAWQSSW